MANQRLRNVKGPSLGRPMTDDGGRTVLRARLPTQLRPLVGSGLIG